MSCIKFTYSEELLHIFPAFRQRSLLPKKTGAEQFIGFPCTIAQRQKYEHVDLHQLL